MKKLPSLLLHGLGFGVAALLLTPIIYYGLGAVLYDQRSSWSEGTGSGFVAFLAAVFATPIAVLLWSGVGARIGALRRRGDVSRRTFVSLITAAIVAWCIVGLVAQILADYSV